MATFKGCVMIFPIVQREWKDLIQDVGVIASEHLQELEFDPHTTVVYGLDSDVVSAQVIKPFVTDFFEKNPLNISLGQITHFECPEYDVLKFDVVDNNDNLHVLNALLRSKFPYQNEHLDYQPHVTLAYVNKGEGARLASELNELWSNDDLLNWSRPHFKYSSSRSNVLGEWTLTAKSNYIIAGDKVFTNPYTVDLLSVIQKAEINDIQDEVKAILYEEFSALILQGLIMFGYVYTDNEENRLRGRVGKFSGFRKGTQYLKYIPNNKRPRSRSTESTCLRYYDHGRMNWRSFKKNLFVVATSFYDQRDNTWKQDPIEAGFTTLWSKINKLNNGFKYSNRADTEEEAKLRKKIAEKARERREREIKRTSKK